MSGNFNTPESESAPHSLESVLNTLLAEAILRSRKGTDFMSEVGVSHDKELARLILHAQRIGYAALDIETKEDFIAWAKKYLSSLSE